MPGKYTQPKGRGYLDFSIAILATIAEAKFLDSCFRRNDIEEGFFWPFIACSNFLAFMMIENE